MEEIADFRCAAIIPACKKIYINSNCETKMYHVHKGISICQIIPLQSTISEEQCHGETIGVKLQDLYFEIYRSSI